MLFTTFALSEVKTIAFAVSLQSSFSHDCNLVDENKWLLTCIPFLMSPHEDIFSHRCSRILFIRCFPSNWPLSSNSLDDDKWRGMYNDKVERFLSCVKHEGWRHLYEAEWKWKAPKWLWKGPPKSNESF